MSIKILVLYYQKQWKIWNHRINTAALGLIICARNGRIDLICFQLGSESDPHSIQRCSRDRIKTFCVITFRRCSATGIHVSLIDYKMLANQGTVITSWKPIHNCMSYFWSSANCNSAGRSPTWLSINYWDQHLNEINFQMLIRNQL